MIWSLPFLAAQEPQRSRETRVVIILNQPFSVALFLRLQRSCKWVYCADGGANRLFDLFEDQSALGNGLQRNE